MATRGTILEVAKTDEEPLGSSGIQIRFETDLLIESTRPGRVVRVRPASWPPFDAPREEYRIDAHGLEEYFPTPTIFPKY